MMGIARRQRLDRSAGTATPIDVLRRGFRPPSRVAMAEDIRAIDRGEGRTVACLFRGMYGAYPRRFKRKMLELTPDCLIVRPFWSSPSRSRFKIGRDEITDGQLRSRSFSTDINVPATGVYSPGGIFGWAGFDTILCKTSSGMLEFAVPRPDVPLFLHYISPKP